MEHGDELFRPFGMNDAGGNGNDPMASFRVKSDDVIALPIHSDGHLQFVAIAVGQIALDCGRDAKANPRDLAQGVLDDVPFKAQLGTIGEMLQLTSPAAGEDGALFAHPFLRGREHFLDFSVPDFVLDFEHAKSDFFARQTIRHEKSDSFVPDNPFAVTAQCVRYGTNHLIFFRHKSSFPTSSLFCLRPRRSPRNDFLPSAADFPLLYIGAFLSPAFERRERMLF